MVIIDPKAPLTAARQYLAQRKLDPVKLHFSQAYRQPNQLEPSASLSSDVWLWLDENGLTPTPAMVSGVVAALKALHVRAVQERDARQQAEWVAERRARFIGILEVLKAGPVNASGIAKALGREEHYVAADLMELRDAGRVVAGHRADQWAWSLASPSASPANDQPQGAL